MHDTDSPVLAEASAAPDLQALPAGLSRRLQECQTLPSLPAAVSQVLRLSREEEVGTDQFARAIEPDPALTLRVVALANSAYYRRAGQDVVTCHDAVSRLGSEATLAAVMSFGLQAARIPEPLWHRAVIASVAARELAQRLCPESAGLLFTSALLQDIGVIGLLALDDEAYRRQLPHHGEHLRLMLAEHDAYGCDHALIGAWLALSWGVPPGLARCIADSHGPLEDGDMARLCLRLSGRIADARLAPDPGVALARLAQQLEHLEGLQAMPLAPLLQALHARLPAMSQLLALTQPLALDDEDLLHQGKQRLVELTLSLSTRLQQRHRELDDLRRENAALEQRSHTDPMTGLANRAWLEHCLDQRLDETTAQAGALALLFIDLDHFKQLNDRHGHGLGDRVLINFASALRELVREGDLAGRYGGEEFVVILPGETSDGARVVASRLLALLVAQPMAEVAGEPLFVSASIGIASLEDAPIGSAQEMIATADRQMYRAKRDGRARVSTVRPG
ncbi:sensor domain-containing diguanylate cyclase [Halomonas nitroreducens]|uniref:sensor domain-containing diguanylate cyclase n=1 Tax=Halomonas nitroreducens TaxID=447425 RepID=UPI00163A0B69|nr:GGDEF domain-containing protein [Halomonas nitroreducens]